MKSKEKRGVTKYIGRMASKWDRSFSTQMMASELIFVIADTPTTKWIGFDARVTGLCSFPGTTHATLVLELAMAPIGLPR